MEESGRNWQKKTGISENGKISNFQRLSDWLEDNGHDPDDFDFEKTENGNEKGEMEGNEGKTGGKSEEENAKEEISEEKTENEEDEKEEMETDEKPSDEKATDEKTSGDIEDAILKRDVF